MSSKVINPKSKRLINVDSDIFKKLLKEGYIFENNILIKPNIKMDEEYNDDVMFVETTDEDLKIKSLGLDDFLIENVIHISDIHIPLHLHANRKEEYLSVFNNLYEQIKYYENKVIVITGDLLHVKLTLESETIILARNFLKTLISIAPTIVIIGNHDFTENNLERADTLSAICHNLDIHILKYTGLYRLGNIVFSFSSLFDKKFIYRKNINTDLPVYKLFHGTVLGSVNYNGTINSKSVANKKYPTISDFDGYDAVLLGHIHKYQNIRPHIAYAGSLIQQNYGETIDYHGCLIWNTKTHKPTFIQIINEYIFIDAIINEGIIENLSHLEKYKNKYLRIRCILTNTSSSQYSVIQKKLSNEFNVVEFKTINKNVCDFTHQNPQLTHDDFDDDYYIKKHAKPELCKNIINLHNSVKRDFENSNNFFCWNIVQLRFKNMFIYGDDKINTIDFNDGIFNICSPNMTGKSSIVYIILFALFDQTSHNFSKKTNIVHLGKLEGFINLTFIHNGQLFLIEKSTIVKTIRNNKIISFDTNFYKLNPTLKLNGKDSKETYKIIKQYVGDFDTFIRHNIISTRFGSSIMNMEPADKLKHFHHLFNTDVYELYHKKVINENKKINEKLSNFQGQLSHIQKNISEININEEQILLTKLTDDCNNVDTKLHSFILNIQQQSLLLGSLSSNITYLKSQLKQQPCISPPENKLHYITSIAHLEQQILTIKPDEILYAKCGQSCDLANLLVTYSSFIKICDYDKHYIENQIANIELILNNKPKNNLDTLKISEFDLSNKIKIAKKEIDFIGGCFDENIDTSAKQNLLETKLKLEKQLIFISEQITYDLDYYTKQLNELEISAPTDTTHLHDKLAIVTNQISVTDQQINNIDVNTLINTDLSKEQLCSQIKDERTIGSKFSFDLNELDELQQYLINTTSTNKCQHSKIDLINKKNDICAQISSITIHFDIEFDTNYYQQQLNELNKPNESIDVLKNMLAVKTHLLNELNISILKFNKCDVIQTEETIEYLHKQIKQLLFIDEKQSFDVDVFDNLNVQIKLLSDNHVFTDLSQIYTIFDNLTYDVNNFTFIHQENVDLIKHFIISVENGTFVKLSKLINEKQQMISVKKFNDQIDSNTKTNQDIKISNDIIMKKINWIELCNINDKVLLLQTEIEKINSDINYYLFNDIIRFLDLQVQLDNINKQLVYIDKFDRFTILVSQHKHNLQIDNDIQFNNIINKQLKWLEYQRLLDYKTELFNEQVLLNKSIEFLRLNNIIHNLQIQQQINIIDKQLGEIELYELTKLVYNLEIDLSDVKKEIILCNNYNSALLTKCDLLAQSQIIDDNIKYQLLIDQTKQLYDIALLYEQIKIFQNFVDDWNNIEHNCNLNIQIDNLLEQSNVITTEIYSLQLQYSEIQNKSENLKSQIVSSKANITKHQQLSQEIIEVSSVISDLNSQLCIYEEYIRLFHRNCIPFDIITSKLNSITSGINQIFKSYTKFQFHNDLFDGKLDFYVSNQEGLHLDIDRLSGFEFTVLQLAINQTVLFYTKQQAQFLIIDESFDCFDQNRFISVLPELFEVMRMFYRTILLISHRSVPDSCIDKQINIHHSNSSSLILN